MKGTMMKEKSSEIHISVRNLVEFILREGSIDNRRSAAPDNAMQEGSRIHRMIQRRMGADYAAEVSLQYSYPAGDYTIIIEGRADGIIRPENGTVAEGKIAFNQMDNSLITVDEIKGTYKEVNKMKEPVFTHLAQAKCYAFIYAEQNNLERIRVRMTYCNIDTEELRYFHEEYSYAELQTWFEEIMSCYRKWADHEFEWKEKRSTSIQKVIFPFPYRNGQKELVTYVYQTIYHKKKLFIEAPTGVGKTISTVFPAVKSVGEGRGDKIFYLTAKTITRTVAEEAFQHLRKSGLKFKTVLLTAKDKICFMEKTECNPLACPYASGHYDRVNEAVYELLTSEDNFSRSKIEEYARKHQVCPFEMCLDISLFADGVICDYNYLFDPHVYLKRFFGEGVRGDYIFLIDEAHNLVDRGREMYSAVLRKEDLLALKRTVGDYDAFLARQLEKCNKEMLALKRECEKYQVEPFVTPLMRAVTKLGTALDNFLDEFETNPVREEVLKFYFEVSHFLAMNERVDDNYVIYSQLEQDGDFTVKLFCVNPTLNLKECMMRGRSTILFSATFLPVQYYKRLLGAVPEDYEVYAQSVFQPDKKALFIARDVTSKYSRRSDSEYYNMALYIHEIIRSRRGNYMIFFPSHIFLQRVYEVYAESFKEQDDAECILQEDRMNEESREEFLNRFTAEGRGEGTLLGFCVLGGIFSEGIDLKNDSLIGAIIVGTGLPQVCNEREIIKQYFDKQGDNGFDFAYRHPGMNKVLQAAGRVIRTKEDIGIVVLLDERFQNQSYRRLFPREWESYDLVTAEQIAGRVEKFWNDWL